MTFNKTKNKYMNMKSMIVCLVTLSACGTSPEQTSVPASLPTTESSLPVVEEEKPSAVSPVITDNSLMSTGKVKAANYTDLYFRSQEQIAHVYVKNGARVRKGQKLADLELFSLNSQLRQAEISLEQAKLELQDILIGQGYDADKLDGIPADMMKLAKVKSGYEQAVLQKEIALREIENATLVAPFDGVIANLTAQPYHMAGNEPFCRIIQTNNMEVEFQVLENELHLIKMGQEVEIKPQTSAISIQKGEICGVNPVVDEKGLIQVRARVKGNVGLMEGMNVMVCIQQ